MYTPLRRTVFLSLMLLMTALFCGALFYPWQSLSGSGLTRTVNLLTWMLAGAWGVVFTAFVSPRWRMTKTSVLVVVGLLLLNLPALWTPRIFWPEALYRLAGTGALATLLWVLLPLPLRGGQRHALYAVVVLAALVQAVQGGWQVLFPHSAAHWLDYDYFSMGGRATGAFGQANLLGSFLATGMLCSLWLMLSAGRSMQRWLAGIAAIPLCIVLILSESRSAWLGAITGVAILLICAGSHRQRLQTIAVLTVAVLFGLFAQSLRPSVSLNPPVLAAPHTDEQSTPVQDRLATDRRASEHERLSLAKGALRLIAAHPLAGNGTGSFESAFPVALAHSGEVNPFPVTVAYPHNELLYVWSEGGVIALAGLLCWLAIWLKPFRALPGMLSLRHQTGSRHEVARAALTLPLMMHVMTEFPFYLSAAHGVLMVVLLWLSLPASARRRDCSRAFTVTQARTIQAAIVIFCLSGVAFMATGLQASVCIQRAEQFHFQDMSPLSSVLNPLAQPERLQFDLAEENLLRFNASRDTHRLWRFQQQARPWLARHNDAWLTDAMMRIAQAKHDGLEAGYWRQRGCMSFHSDPRFHCDSITLKGRSTPDE